MLTESKRVVVRAFCPPKSTVVSGSISRKSRRKVDAFKVPLQARPTRVLFGTLKTPAAVEKSVSLVAGQAGPTPLRADATDPRIAAEVRAAEAPGQWTLAVHLDPEKAPLPAEKSETIRADVLVRAEDGKLVGKVPVHAVLSAQGP